MKKILFFPLFCTLLISCGKSEEEKQKEKVDKAEDKIEKLNSISSTLSTDYGVIIQTSSSTLYSSSASDSGASLNKLRQSECLEGKNLLEKYVSLGNDVLDVADEDGVFYADEYKLENAVSSASSILSYVTCPAHEGVNFDFDFAEAEDNFERDSGFHFSKSYDYASYGNSVTKVSLKIKEGYTISQETAEKSLKAMKLFITEVKTNTTNSSRSQEESVKLELVEQQVTKMKDIITIGTITDLNREILDKYSSVIISETIDDKKELLVKVDESLKLEELLKNSGSTLSDNDRLDSIKKLKNTLVEAITKLETISVEPVEIITPIETTEEETNQE